MMTLVVHHHSVLYIKLVTKSKYVRFSLKIVERLSLFDSFILVNASTNIRDNDVNFKHIIEHALSCTLEEDGEDESSCVGLRFGTILEVLNVGQMKLH